MSLFIPASGPGRPWILVPHNKGLFFFPTTMGRSKMTLLGPGITQSDNWIALKYPKTEILEFGKRFAYKNLKMY